MITLRPDQQALTGRVRERFSSGVQSVLVVAPCGFGKTVCFASLTAQVARTGRRVMALVHREELLDQVSDTLSAFNVEHGCIAPGRPNYGQRPVQVASVFTLARRLADYAPPDLLIVDEAHHASANTWGKVFAAWPNAYRLGLSASPERLDGSGLGDVFQEMLVGPTVRELIDQGSLSDYRLYAPPTTVTQGLHTRMGDFDKKELHTAMDKPKITGNAVEHYKSLASGKRALVNCVSLDHAAHVVADFRAAGYRAARIDGKMEPWARRTLVRDFRENRLTILVSCEIVNEGFDVPGVEVAILLRPTKSLVLFTQQVGRALRPCKGKEYALILDHCNNTATHGLPDDARDWSLQGKETRRKSEGEPSLSVRTCGQCFAACRSGTPACPYCGYQFPIESRTVEEVEGTLTEVERQIARRVARQEQGRANDLTALVELGKQRQYRYPLQWAQRLLAARQRKHVAHV